MTPEAIWSTYSRDLVHYAAGLVGPTDAEDVVAKVFLRILETKGFSAIEEPRPYLFRSVLNECRMSFRSQDRRAVRQDHFESVIPPPDVQLEIFDAVLTLPIQQKAVVYLIYWEGLRVEEVADLMGIGAGTVKRYLHLARTKLRRQLNEQPVRGVLIVE